MEDINERPRQGESKLDRSLAGSCVIIRAKASTDQIIYYSLFKKEKLLIVLCFLDQKIPVQIRNSFGHGYDNLICNLMQVSFSLDFPFVFSSELVQTQARCLHIHCGLLCSCKT